MKNINFTRRFLFLAIIYPAIRLMGAILLICVIPILIAYLIACPIIIILFGFNAADKVKDFIFELFIDTAFDMIGI